MLEAKPRYLIPTPFSPPGTVGVVRGEKWTISLKKLLVDVLYQNDGEKQDTESKDTGTPKMKQNIPRMMVKGNPRTTAVQLAY